MTKIIKPKILKGFRDFLPEKMAVRQVVEKTMREVFESFGYQPLETPALEYQETLLGKYGEEADKLVYTFEDKGGRKVGLKYDLTVPTSRVAAMYPDLVKPFKRYQIQNVWRADKPQKSRYREFTMCDVDSIGTASPLADAEIIAVIFTVLKKLNFKEFTIRMNSRQVLFEILKKAGISEKQKFSVIQTLDKLDKKPKEEVIKELQRKGLTEGTVKNLFSELKRAKPDPNLEQVFMYLKYFDVDPNFYKFDPILARGLDYYTGPIYETLVKRPKIGSLTGGGRYDKLIGMFTGQDIPATGTCFGFDRICDCLEELKILESTKKISPEVLVTIFNPEFIEPALAIFNKLRKQNLKAEIYLNPQENLNKQIKYADKKGISYVVIVGPDEVAKGEVTLKNMKNRSQKRISADRDFKTDIN